MRIFEKIVSELRRLPPEDQAQVLGFVEFLKQKTARKEEQLFNDFSLSAVMRDMEEEPELYSDLDIREPI
jgi:hypothetical protein